MKCDAKLDGDIMPSDQELLDQQMNAVAETIREYAAQIRSGEYGDEWTILDGEGNAVTVSASSESEALDKVYDTPEHRRNIVGEAADWTIERDSVDEPSVDGTDIFEYPLEVVAEIGREYAVVICTGGPHIEVVADGQRSARLEGYWGGTRATRSGDYLDTFLDWFIER